MEPVQIKAFCFHRVSGGVNLAVRFNAREAIKMSVVASATIEPVQPSLTRRFVRCRLAVR
ncbi:MAG: hypothetical protein MSG64_00705 [Pyrinomonadaceae bacterium MAG19_C2-C3]|nr:hypothetical protein [Pyrinomonadaceae bacterium MAG19_C2-C3]